MTTMTPKQKIATLKFPVRVTIGDMEVGMWNKDRGYFQHQYNEDLCGGLWFDDEHRLCDYDGAYSLPEEAVKIIRQIGFVVPDEFTD